MAKKYGVPPSHWFPELDPLERYMFDLHVTRDGAREEERQHQRAERRARMRR